MTEPAGVVAGERAGVDLERNPSSGTGSNRVEAVVTAPVAALEITALVVKAAVAATPVTPVVVAASALLAADKGATAAAVRIVVFGFATVATVLATVVVTSTTVASPSRPSGVGGLVVTAFAVVTSVACAADAVLGAIADGVGAVIVALLAAC